MANKKKSTLGRVIGLLGAKDRRNLAIVFAVSLIAALIDVLGVGSIAPFIAVASNPDIIHTNAVLNAVYTSLGFTRSQDFLVTLGVAVIIFLVFTSTFKALTRFVVVRFTSQARHRLTMKLMDGYLRQDYPFFLNRNSHEFVKNINGEVQLTVQGTLMTFVEMVGYSLQLFLFVTLLMVTNPWTTLLVAISVGSVYGAIYGGLRKTVKRLGQKRFDLNRERSRIISETFWGIKDTKLLGVEAEFLEQYKQPSAEMAKNESQAELAGDIPRFALEAFAFSAILIFVIWVTLVAGSFQDAAATVGLFAFASYRMIPAMQNLFKALNKMRYSAPAATKICQEFESVAGGETSIRHKAPRMTFHDRLVIEDLGFTYPLTERPVLRGVNLSVSRHETIGFAGSTGSGKTTLIDLVLGLLVPGEGRILVDGLVLDRANRRSWQAIIGYVPQAIYLSNTSIAQNIAFGVPPERIDLEKVERAAKMAQIHDFVTQGLVQGYQTEVGERGVRLSGGQRQRLGIARALYREPEILVFDEATSALDTETEAAVMEAVHELAGQLTVLMIAHRLTTLKECNRIYILEAGQVADVGTFAELSSRRRNFGEHR